MTVTAETPFNLGPALSLVDAILSTDVKALKALRRHFDNPALVDSVCELTHRFIVASRAHLDSNRIVDLMDEHLGQRARYDGVVIRVVDRRLRYTKALRHARQFSGALLEHYLRHAYYLESSERTSSPPRYAMKPIFIPRSRSFTLGLGYSITLTAVRLAELDQADIAERLRAYRALAARESLTAKH